MGLSPTQIESAKKYNADIKGKDPASFQACLIALGLTVATPADDVAKAVGAFQVARKLSSDGMMGPNTQKAVLEPATAPANYFIVGGKKVPVSGLKVITMKQKGGKDLVAATDKGYNARPKDAWIDLVVFHYDGCWTTSDCYSVLTERGTAVTFGIDSDNAATVYQFLDISWSAWGQDQWNGRSIGIEIANPEMVSKNDGRYGMPIRPVIEVGVYNAGDVHKKITDFTEVQKKVALQLANELCRIFGVKRQLPAYDPARDGKYGPRPEDGVARGLIPSGKDRTANKVVPGYYEGIAGHYHGNSNKVDPSTGLWKMFVESGYTVST